MSANDEFRGRKLTRQGNPTPGVIEQVTESWEAKRDREAGSADEERVMHEERIQKLREEYPAS